MKKILLLEDDASLIDGLKYSLSKNGFSADFVGTVKEAKIFLKTEKYDFLMLLFPTAQVLKYVILSETPGIQSPSSFSLLLTRRSM